MIKTEGELAGLGAHARAAAAWSASRSRSRIVSLWTPLMDPQIAARWFSWPNIALLAPVPGHHRGADLVRVALARARASEIAPFIGSLGAVRDVLSRHRDQPVADDRAAVTSRCEQAASSPSTQAFLLIGTLFLLPVILIYTGWSYWVFRGKVKQGYH